MLELLKNTVEYQKWGFNAPTIGAIGIIFFAFVEGWGLLKQNQKIWQERSGESVSFRWFTYLGSYFIASIFYGLYIKSISVTFGAILPGLLHIPIIVGMIKFKQLAQNEKIQSALFLIMILAMVILPQKDLVYILLSIGTIYALATQPLELYRTKSVGVVEIKLILVYIASSVFWTIFGFSTKALGIMIVSPCALILLGLTLIMWRKYKKLEASKPAN